MTRRLPAVHGLSPQRRQELNRRVLDKITKWKLQQWLVDGSLTLDEYTRAKWIWQPSGIPIFDPRTEIAAFETEVSNVFNSRTNIARERGMDFRQLVQEIAKEEQMIKDAGIEGVNNRQAWPAVYRRTERKSRHRARRDRAGSQA